MQDMTKLGGLSNTLRSDRARIRQSIRTGQMTVEELLDTVPGSVANLPLMDLLRLIPGMGEKRIMVLNGHAVRDGVNLMVPLRSADLRLRGWLFSHVRRTPRTDWVEFSGYRQEAA